MRDRLAALGLELFPVTSGSKGMQLYAGCSAVTSRSDQVRDLAMQLAQEMTKKHPDLMLWKMTKSLRPGKIFLDWSQNVAAKTTISPYSLRGKETAHASRRPGRGTRSRRAPRAEKFEQLMFDEVLDRLERDGDLIADLL